MAVHMLFITVMFGLHAERGSRPEPLEQPSASSRLGTFNISKDTLWLRTVGQFDLPMPSKLVTRISLWAHAEELAFGD